MSTIALGVVLAACAVKQEDKTLVRGCNPGGNCRVDVIIGANCAITVDPPDPLKVPLPRGRKSITWTIATDGFVFTANGIAFKKGYSEFVEPDLSGTANKFKWTNKHTTNGEYEYAINVIRTGLDPVTCSKDPWISNE